MYLVSELVTSALSIIKRMEAGPEPVREAGVMQMISRLVRLVKRERGGRVISDWLLVCSEILINFYHKNEN